MPGIDRGAQRTGDQAGPQPGLYLQQPQMASSNKPQWAGGTPHVVSAPTREKTWQQEQQDLKHREYLKQQQRLKAMGVPNNKNVSADALIGNLLEKKETFRPKQSVTAPAAMHGVPSTAPVARTRTEQRAVNEELPPWIWPGSARLPPVYSHIWTLVVDPASGGTLVDTNRIFPLLLTSGLPTQVLGFIWNLAAQGVPGLGDNIQGTSGQLSQQQLYVVLALVALAQTGCTFNSLSILKMLPQPPIPMFNMGTKGSTDTPAPPVSHPVPSPVAPIHPVGHPVAMPSQVPGSAPVPAPVAVIPNTGIAATPSAVPAHQEEPFFSSDPKEDDFTEFQSADIPSSIPSATVVQPSSAAKQVVSELNQSVLARLGNQGRSIGSRLANHTLGAPKTSRSHHHKHQRSDRRASMDVHYFDDEVTFGGGRSRKVSHDNSRELSPCGRHQHEHEHGDGVTESESDDFNDFQMANVNVGLNVDELFPKCKQIKKRTVLLKESAIRNESEEKPEIDILALDPPVPEQVDPLPEPLPLPPPPLQPPPQTISSTPQPPPSQTQPPPSIGKELMTVQEDKYSALRFLEVESTPTPSDDFGDFVSADDSFAEIAERKPSDPALSLFAPAPEDAFPAISETDTGKSLSAELEPTARKVEEANAVDDWLSFESSAAPAESSRPALEDLNSMFCSLNVGAEPKLQIKASMNEEMEDEFGDFVGPDMWGGGGDDESGKLAATLSSDNRSVSSFEMTNASLSRHGSLPSLDLKIFPQGDDPVEKFRQGCVPMNEWQRCLECCVSLLQSAVNTFACISSQDVVLEVLATAEGRSYFINLKEVRYVCNRIRYSYYRCGQELNQIDTLLKSAQQAWDSLDRYYKLADIDTVDNENREENGAAMCCICCCPATTEALEYNGHAYHASCANLWLNCV